MIIYGPFPYIDEKTVPVMNPVFQLAYGAFHRILWSTIFALIIFLCFHGYGGKKISNNKYFIEIIWPCLIGKFNKFLSSKFFLPFSRLSYSIYLVNFILISAHLSYFRMPFNVEKMNSIIMMMGMVTLILILSVFLTICIEMPFRNLEKTILKSTNPIKLTNKKIEEVSLPENTR